MVEKAMSICEKALNDGQHPGYSEWFVRDMVSHLVNVRATIAREKPDLDYGLALSQEVCDIRERNRRTGSFEDATWIAAARGNMAVSMMEIGRSEEALAILLELLLRPDMKPNEDLYLCNLCLCYICLGRLDEAWLQNVRAAESVKAIRGDNTVQMAMEVPSLSLVGSTLTSSNRSLFYLAKIHQKRGDAESALTELDRCLQIRKLLMPFHHYTGFTLHEMGLILRMNNRHEDSMYV